MRKFFAVAMGSVVALVGFASTANASATVDLVWIDNSTVADCTKSSNRNCVSLGSTLSNVAVSDNITLLVLLTAGDGGSIGAGVSMDYTPLVTGFTVDRFRRFNTKPYLPGPLGSITNQPPFIDNINAAASPATGAGIGLGSGGSAYLGTVSFVKDLLVNGTFEIGIGVNGPGGTDDVLDGAGSVISDTTTFNSAFLVNVPEPGALSLLVMGVGGMLLAGRGRRS